MARLNGSLQWCHNKRDDVSNHQHHDWLFNRLLRRRSKKTLKLCVTGLCEGNSPVTVNSPHKGHVTQKIFPFDFFIMFSLCCFFQVLDPNDITGNISSPQVLNETHSITSTGMVSRLVLNVSVVEPKIYQCQFNMRDGQKCRENIEVIFRGMLNLSIQEIISLNDVISYFCMIDWRNYFLRSMTCNVAGIYWPNMVCSLRFAKLSITS